MIASIAHNPHVSPFRAVEGDGNDSLITRIWNAVVEFFTLVAQKIKEGAEAVWTTLKSCFGCADKPEEVVVAPARPQGNRPEVVVQPPLVDVPLNQAVRAKLNAYNNMPRGDVPFMRRAVEIVRPLLQRKDERLRQALAAKLGVDAGQLAQMMEIGKNRFTRQMGQRQPPIQPQELPYQLETFNSQIDNLEGECFPKLLKAAIRAYVFSPAAHHNYNLTYFAHMENVFDDVLPEIPGVHVGGRQRRHVYVDYFPQMRQTKALFNSLPNESKETVLDEYDSEIDALNLPPNGRRVLQDVSRISDALLQDNAPFDRASRAFLQGAH